jgi:ABC-type transport system involved in multi-copper enzyme maturation permease subunit
MFGQVLPVGLSLAVLAGITLVSLAAAFGIFTRREYVLEQ